MIRILQQDNKAIKAIFAVIIGLAVVTMVITLVPGIFDNTGAGADTATYATVREPGFFNKIFGETQTVTQTDVARQAEQQLQQQKLPEFLLSYMEQRAGQALIQQAILKLEGDRLGLQVTDADLARELHQGQLGQILFPNGKYIGDDEYMNFVQNQLQMRVPEFEALVKKEMEQNRLEALITGGVTVSDNDVRNAYRVQGTKVKFDYAVVSADDIAKTIDPSDSDLQAYFKKNQASYATAVPETRKIEYFSFGEDQLPGGKPQVTDADIQAYYNAHQADYQVKDRVRVRHILIAVKPGADAATDAAAKAKAEDLLKQIRAGGDFAALAKANSDDPGSKTQGGELGFLTPGQTVPEFDKTAFSLQLGQTSSVIKTQFGYHILQVEEKETAHTKPLAEVKNDIVNALATTKLTSAEQSYANQLTAEAKKDGIDKTAAAHGLHAITTDYLAKDGTIAGVSDGTQMLTQAFMSARNAPPANISVGDGYAVFQVTDIKPPHAPTFAEWRSHILSDYRDSQVPQMVQARVAKLSALAKQTGDLRKAAAQLNLTVQTSDLVGKDGQVPDLGAMNGPADVAFSLPKGGISGPISANRNGVVLELLDKQEPSADDIAKNFAQTKQEMLGQAKEEVFRVYLGTLTQQFEKAGSIRMKAKPVEPALPGGPAGS
jgi:peptidyl-prolyl cis-trans isomerase D